MALEGMLSEVTQAKVRGLLDERDPIILDTEIPEEVERFEARVQGAAVQVLLLTGTNPPAGPIRDLAVEAIALQTGSEIEYATYPEQQAAGDTGRGYHLHQRYLELLGDLRRIIERGGGIPDDGGSGGPVLTSPHPLGTFPAPSAPVPGVDL